MTHFRPFLARWMGLLLALAGCGPAQSGEEGEYLLDPLTVEAVEPAEWLLGTRVVLRGTGFIGAEVGTMTATIRGRLGDRDVAVRLDIGAEGPERATFVVTEALWAHLVPEGMVLDPAGDGVALAGTLVVERTGPRGVSGGASFSLAVRIVSGLTPTLRTMNPVQVYPGEEVTVEGSGFLLPGEGNLDPTGMARLGTTWLRLSGRVTGEEGSHVRDLGVPLIANDRNRAFFRLTPDLMGLGPFEFEGTAEVRNVFVGQSDSVEIIGNRLDGVVFRMERTRLVALASPLVRRGQVLTFLGNGFLPADGETGTITFFTFTGLERGQGGAAVQHAQANPLVFVPDTLEGNTRAHMVLRTLVGPDQRPTGLGARPATLTGVFTPHLVFRNQMVVGEGLQATLEIGRQVQVVWVRFLPTFEDGLDGFGLRAVAEQVKERALAVCAQDYQGVSVEFRRDRPEDFVQYVTVEVMGRDPNEAGLFGLDNSFGKDVGNLVFDERIGGYDATSDRAGFYPYGGVFVDSFRQFSPSLAQGVAQEFASEAFDAVFGPVMPALGGKAVTEEEAAGGGTRAHVIAEAVRVLGNLIGDTISHEVGHVLGLAAVEGDVHDPGDNPGYIMDAGIFRPFEERAQLPGAFPRVFAPYDRAYLEEILPAR